jgi:hypothetical protein
MCIGPFTAVWPAMLWAEFSVEMSDFEQVCGHSENSPFEYVAKYSVSYERSIITYSAKPNRKTTVLMVFIPYLAP